MKKTLLLALGLTLVAAQAQAISRYNSQSMSCSHTQAVVRQDGAAILRYSSSSGLPLYDRYVASGGFCPTGQYAKAEYVPTSDTANCPVLACAEFSDDSMMGDN